MREGLENSLRNNPIEAARRRTRAPLRQRFYKLATVAADGEAFALRLDDKPVRTPAGRALVVPRRALAQSLAAEWNAQGETIDPATMPLTRLVNVIIDGVSDHAASVAAEVGNYLASDLLCYRAGSPRGLVERQKQHWDPILDWAREALDARLLLAEGVVHVPQPQGALAAVRAAIPNDPWRLGAVHSVTTLTGSALIALALAHGRLGADEAWQAAHVDEDWNMKEWGRDEIALARRAMRFAELQAAVTVLKSL